MVQARRPAKEAASRRAEGVSTQPQAMEVDATVKRKGRKDKGKRKAKETEPAPVAVDDPEDASAVPPARLESIIDSTLPSCPPLLTADGRYARRSQMSFVLTNFARYILVAAPQLAMHVFSVETAELVATLDDPLRTTSTSGDAVRIISILRHPSSDSDILVVMSDGSLVVFDYAEGEVVGRYDTACTVFAATTAGLTTSTPVQKDDGSQTAFAPMIRLVVAARDSPRHGAYVFLLPADSPSPDSVVRLERKTLLFHLGALSALAASASGAWVGGVGGSQICVTRLSDELSIGGTLKRPRTASFSAPEAISTITFPPDLDADASHRPVTYFATGAASGRIVLWHALDPRIWDSVVRQQADTDDRNPLEPATCPTSILHWHAHAVSDLAFTPNGAYLASAGDEGVVVMWRLESADGNAAKEFLPRLGGPLKYLRMQTGVESGTVLLVTRADGDVLVVDPALLRLQKIFAGPKAVCPAPTASVQPLVARRDGSIMLPSSVASALQIVHGDGKVDEIEVAASNRVSARDDKPLAETTVQFAAVGGQADDVMATIDFWRDDERDWEPETRLKFWKRGSDGQ